jgi:hypothetical protein
MPAPVSGEPESWVVGYVTIEFIGGDRNGEMIPYGPGNVAALPPLVYMKILNRDFLRVAEAFGRDPTDETRKELEAIRDELLRMKIPPEEL